MKIWKTICFFALFEVLQASQHAKTVSQMSVGHKPFPGQLPTPYKNWHERTNVPPRWTYAPRQMPKWSIPHEKKRDTEQLQKLLKTICEQLNSQEKNVKPHVLQASPIWMPYIIFIHGGGRVQMSITPVISLWGFCLVIPFLWECRCPGGLTSVHPSKEMVHVDSI